MRTLVARIFDYSLDGVIATEGTSFFDFCRDLPDDEAQLDRTRAFYEHADVHIFSHTITTADWANTSVANGDLAAEIEKLKLDGDGHIVAHGGLGFLRSLIVRDLVDEYRVTLFPYLAGKGARLFDDLGQPARLELASATAFGNGTTELAFRRDR